MEVRALLIALFLAISSACAAAPDDDHPVLVGTVIKIVDGDTLDVKLDSGSMRVRLHGVDTPERGQPHGKQATAALTALVIGRQVELEITEQKDRYDRAVAIVFVNGINVNAALVKSGHAFAYRRYMRQADGALCAMEAEARLAKRGIWAQPGTDNVAPWQWRQRKKLKAVVDYSGETVARCVAAIGVR